MTDKHEDNEDKIDLERALAELEKIEKGESELLSWEEFIENN